MDALAAARADRRPAGLAELWATDWHRPGLAVCLLVDASGSMTGARLAASAMTAAACAWRAPGEFAVLSFARDVRVHRSIHAAAPPVNAVDSLLALRGHGVTSVAGALAAAADQLATARAARRVTVLLSDCRATDERDPLPAARALDELLVLAPADDCAEAVDLVRRAGGRLATLRSAADAPAALAEALGR